MIELDILKRLMSKGKMSSLFVVMRQGAGSAREIARLTGMAWTPTRQALAALRDEGILVAKRNGNRFVFEANHEHLAIKPLEQFFKALEDVVKSLLDDVRAVLESWGESKALCMHISTEYRVTILTFRSCHTEGLSKAVASKMARRGIKATGVKFVSLDEFKQNPGILHEEELGTGRWIGGNPETLLVRDSEDPLRRKLSFFDF